MIVKIQILLSGNRPNMKGSESRVTFAADEINSDSDKRLAMLFEISFYCGATGHVGQRYLLGRVHPVRRSKSSLQTG